MKTKNVFNLKDFEELNYHLHKEGWEALARKMDNDFLDKAIGKDLGEWADKRAKELGVK